MDLIFVNNFSKRTNSTKQPNAGISVQVELKEAVSLNTPIFLVAVQDKELPTYVWWKFKEKNYYYYVNDIVVVRNNLFELHCTLDYMATFREQILNSKQLIAYSTIKSDNRIQDRRLIPSNDMIYIKSFGDKSVLPNNNNCIVLNCASNNPISNSASGGVGQYVFDNTVDFKDFISNAFKMYDPISDIEEVVKKFLSGTSPDNLLSARYYHYTPPLTNKTTATIGTWDSGQEAYCISNSQSNVTVLISNIWGSVPNYARNDTYCSMSLFLPFIGVQNLSIDEMASVDELQIDYHFDNVNGTFRAEILLVESTDKRIAYTFGGSVSAEITFSTFSNNPIQTYIDGAKTVTNVAKLNFSGAVESVVGAVTGTTQAQTTITGGYESRVTNTNITQPQLTLMYRQPVGIDIRDTYGAPYVKKEIVSNHKNGYIQTSNAEYGLEITTLGQWFDSICATMNSGFFVE